MPALGAAPPGLYHDEAYYGLDAREVLAGNGQIYFPANHGREPLFIYLVAISVGLFGPTPFAERLPSALVGILTIPATYWMARQLWGRRVGLIAAALMAVTLWPMHLSRVGFRVVTLPLFVALGIGLTARAWRSGLRRDGLIAGAVWGLSLYTYIAARFIPVLFILLILFLLIFRRVEAGPFLPDRLSIGALWATVGFGLVIAPLAIYTLGNWDVVMGRPAGVSILEPGINQGDLVGTLINNVFKSIGMFVWQGDRIARHNVPWRPVFDPPMAAAFVAGVVIAIRQARQRIAAVFVLLWMGVMLLPTILAEDAPHFLRAAGVLPVAMLFPALGLDWLLRTNHRGAENTEENGSKKLRALRVSVVILILVFSAGLTLRDYAPYATSAGTGYAFEAGAVQLAEETNRLGTGGYRVVMDDRYLREWAAIPFMLRQSPDVLISAGTDLPTQPDSPAVLVAWPYADWSARLAAWPKPIQINVHAGPLVKGDRDPQPYTMAVLAQIEPRTSTGGAAEATFDGGIRLLGHTIEDRGDTWRLRTLWQIDRSVTGDVTMFVHLLSGDAPVVNADGDAGDGLYPLRLWRVGDVIVDERSVPLPAGADRAQVSIEIGLYDRASGKRVQPIESASPVVDGALRLGSPGAVGP